MHVQSQLNKRQQKLYDALRGHPAWQAAFKEVCLKNGHKWRSALKAQFMTDANVCLVDDKFLPYIRQIRNSTSIDKFDDLFFGRQ